MNTVIAVLEVAERYWLLGVIFVLCGVVVLIGIVEAIQRQRSRK